MQQLSRKIQQVEESQTLALTAKARSLKEAGVDVVSLTAGEPDFPTPKHVKEAAIKAIEADFTHYTATEGIKDLVQAIINKFSRENDLHFEPGQILVSTGAKHSIYNALQAICNKGDEVIILSPYWVSYPEMVKLADATPVVVTASIEVGFKPDIRKLKQAINQRTKAMIINSPSNPTGAVFTRSEMEEIAELVKTSGIYVISDEIYEKVLYDGAKHVSIGSIKSIRDQVITVNGLSKAFAMTGWRLGYMGGPLSVMQLAARVQSQVTSNATSITQKAAVAALTGSLSAVEKMVEEFKQRRDFVIDALLAVKGVNVFTPSGAFYVFFGVKNFYARKFNGQFIRNSADMAQYLLEKQHVAMVPGFAFGADDCLRMSYACSMKDLEKGMKRIADGLAALT